MSASTSLELRAATPEDAGGIARVQVLTWRATYMGLVDDEYLATLSIPEYESRWTEYLQVAAPPSHHVALSHGSLIGFISGGPVRGTHPNIPGEIYALYVLPEFHGSGVGRKLLQQQLADLGTRHLTPVLVWVLEQNPACGFYESMGARRVATKKQLIGEREYDEVGFAWL
jgi:ribosomal protein S18 acetylase RimI-like enzyme